MPDNDLNDLFGTPSDSSPAAPPAAQIPEAPAGPDPLIGSRIGNCILQREIGRGGMGAVYLAHHVGLNKPVAIKVMNAALMGTLSHIQRFLREAQLAASLEHPNVVQVFDVGEANGHYYLAMQYVVGSSVDQILEERGRLPLAEAIPIVKGVARALDAARLKGVVHRDIKPANILLTKDGAVKVVDFGLARGNDKVDGLSIPGQVVGTPYYMSPEQAQGAALDVRSDLYALGATFYHLITGQRPFEGETALAIMMKHLNERPRPPHEVCADLPESVDRVLQSMLAKEPDDRYPTGEAVVQALDAMSAGRPVPIPKHPFGAAAILEAGGETMLDMGRPMAKPARTAADADRAILAMSKDSMLELGGGAAPKSPAAPAPAAGTAATDRSAAKAAPGPGVEAKARAEGKKVVGKYALGKELRPASKGLEIWEATDLRSGRVVTLRILRESDGEAVRQFYKVAADASNLQHPNILKVVETGNDIDARGRMVHFMASEPAAGPSLEGAIAGKQLAPRPMVDLLLGVVEALEYAHRKHVTHLKLTPAEVLAEIPTRFMISFHDLLLPNPADAKKDRGLAAAACLAPEQLPGAEETVDDRTDLYRVGVLLYEACAGRPCFTGTSAAEIHRKIRQENVAPPSQINRNVEPELDALIMKCLNRSKELRFQTAAELALALRQHLKKDAAGTKTKRGPAGATLGSRTRRWMAAHPKPARTIILGILLVLTASGAGGWKLLQAHLTNQAFSSNYVDALTFQREGKLLQAIEAANRAMQVRSDPDLVKLVSECRLGIVDADVSGKLSDLEQASTDPGVDAASYEMKRAALEQMSTELTASMSETREGALIRLQGLAARVLLALGDVEAAQAAFEKALPPGAADPRLSLGLARACVLRLLYLQALDLGDPFEKGAKNVALVELRAKLAEVLARPVSAGRTPMEEEIAEIYRSIAREDREGARLLAEQGAERHGKTPGGEEFRAVLAWTATEVEALQDLDKVLDQRPHLLMATLVRGMRRHAAGDGPGALADYTQLVRVAPGSPEVWLTRGRAIRLQGDADKAREDLLRCRRMAPPGWSLKPELDRQLAAVGGSSK